MGTGLQYVIRKDAQQLSRWITFFRTGDLKPAAIQQRSPVQFIERKAPTPGQLRTIFRL